MPPGPRTRADLSWWALLEMAPALPRGRRLAARATRCSKGRVSPSSASGDRYASLECGTYGGGHGHPDRLHLTLHADGVHWLADPGTGSYVARDLFWYRSTLAHNAPRLDGVSQSPGDAECTAFGESGDWAWARGSYGGFTRTLVAGPRYLLDIVEFSADEEHLVELPWHPAGSIEVVTSGHWDAGYARRRVRDRAGALHPRAGAALLAAIRQPVGRHALPPSRSRAGAGPGDGARQAGLHVAESHAAAARREAPGCGSSPWWRRRRAPASCARGARPAT